mgnify:FL=1
MRLTLFLIGVESGGIGFSGSHFVAMGARMRLIVDLRQMLEIEVRIDLRRCDAGMAEHLLHGTQITRALQHMGGERVTQLVRMHALRQTLALPVLLQAQLDHARRDTPALLANEQRDLISMGKLFAHGEPVFDGIQRGLADVHYAGFVTLT